MDLFLVVSDSVVVVGRTCFPLFVDFIDSRLKIVLCDFSFRVMFGLPLNMRNWGKP